MALRKGTFSAVGIGTACAVAVGNWLRYSLEVANGDSFDGTVLIEKSEDVGQSWTPIATYSYVHGSEGTLGLAEVVIVKPEKPTLYRARCSRFAADSNNVAYRLSEHSDTLIVTDPLELIDVTLNAYETQIVTSGSQGSEQASIGTPSASTPVGTRKLITLKTLTHASDVVILDEGDIVNSSGAALAAATLDAAGAFVLLENNGAAWQVIYSHDATLTAA